MQIRVTLLCSVLGSVLDQADGAFYNTIFKSFLETYDTSLRLVPLLRHWKNPNDPRHGTIRSIFLRLKYANQNLSDAVHAFRAIGILNVSYGLDILSAYEMAKGFFHPILVSEQPVPVDHELRVAHGELIAMYKLKLIMRQNVYSFDDFKVDNLAEMFIENGKKIVDLGHHRGRFCLSTPMLDHGQLLVAPAKL